MTRNTTCRVEVIFPVKRLYRRLGDRLFVQYTIPVRDLQDGTIKNLEFGPHAFTSLLKFGREGHTLYEVRTYGKYVTFHPISKGFFANLRDWFKSLFIELPHPLWVGIPYVLASVSGVDSNTPSAKDIPLQMFLDAFKSA